MFAKSESDMDEEDSAGSLSRKRRQFGITLNIVVKTNEAEGNLKSEA